jgi:hypothetical protein
MIPIPITSFFSFVMIVQFGQRVSLQQLRGAVRGLGTRVLLCDALPLSFSSALSSQFSRSFLICIYIVIGSASMSPLPHSGSPRGTAIVVPAISSPMPFAVRSFFRRGRW